MKFKKKGMKLIKNGTKLETTSKGYTYSLYSNNNLNYYKLIKICFEKDLGSSYDFKLMRNYNSFEIELAILIVKTEYMNKEEKSEDFSFLKFMDTKNKYKFYEILTKGKFKFSTKEELKKLILNSESFDGDEEKEEYYKYLENMDKIYRERLKDILMTEKNSLEELELKYQKELKELEQEHTIEYCDDLINNPKDNTIINKNIRRKNIL